MLRKTLLVLAVASALVACSKDAKNSADKKDGKADQPAVQLLVTPEDMLTVQTSSIASGPVVTGSVQPERKADLRAQGSGGGFPGF